MENKLIDKATLKNIVYRAYNTHEHKDGNWVSFEDHEEALTEAKKEAVRELVEKLEKAKGFAAKHALCGILKSVMLTKIVFWQ